MTNIDQRLIAEIAFRRNPKRDEINDALKREHARREAAVKNLYRLRALRLARDANARLSKIKSIANTRIACEYATALPFQLVEGHKRGSRPSTFTFSARY
jgi:hypothetical protein